jgi:chromosome segregation ATPase
LRGRYRADVCFCILARPIEMSKPDSDRGHASTGDKATTEMRVDVAHVLTKAEAEPIPEPAQAVAEMVIATGEAQGSALPGQDLHVQAVQLAEYLRRRQKSLDHRESQLHAQIAQLEGEARATRMSFNERVAELEEKERALEARLADLTAADASHGASRKEKKKDLARREKALADREQELEAETERSRSVLEDLSRREDEVREAAQTFQVRKQQLDQAEAVLDDTLAEADQLREQSIAERHRVEEEARAGRQRMAVEGRRAAAELDAKRRSLARRGEHVDQSRAALDQLRAELGRVHREALEIRLATEELWVQLCGSAPPAALTRSLGQVRAKLAEHYRMATAEVAEKKAELETLRGQLAEEHQKLIRQKAGLEQWAAGRQQEVEQQAQRLVAREEELERQETTFNDRVRQWKGERLGYEQEIRRLKAQLTMPDPAPAPA